MTTITATLTMQIGHKSYQVASLSEASAMFCDARDKANTGASRTPTPLIFDGGRQIAYVSYNGRVWADTPQAWRPGDTPLFDNSIVRRNVA